MHARLRFRPVPRVLGGRRRDYRYASCAGVCGNLSWCYALPLCADSTPLRCPIYPERSATQLMDFPYPKDMMLSIEQLVTIPLEVRSCKPMSSFAFVPYVDAAGAAASKR